LIKFMSRIGPQVVQQADAAAARRTSSERKSAFSGTGSFASKAYTVDGVAQGADPSRGAGVTVNPIMRLDQFNGKVLNGQSGGGNVGTI
jgi:hypothetical protein